MKRSISVISDIIAATRYLPLVGHLVLVRQCLELSHSPTIDGGVWTKAVDDNGPERFGTLFRGLITDSRLELHRYKRSGRCRRLAMLST